MKLYLSLCVLDTPAPHTTLQPLRFTCVSVGVDKTCLGTRTRTMQYASLPYKPMWHSTHTHTHSCSDRIRAPLCWPLRQEVIGIFVCVLVGVGVMDV